MNKAISLLNQSIEKLVRHHVTNLISINPLNRRLVNMIKSIHSISNEENYLEILTRIEQFPE